MDYTQYIEYSQEVKHAKLFLSEERVVCLISYDPLFATMKRKGITEYNMIFKQGISANTIHRLKKGLPCSTETLDTLCFILDCEVEDIIKHDKTK